MESLPKLLKNFTNEEKTLSKRMLEFYNELNLQNEYSKEIVLIILTILFKFQKNLELPFSITREETNQLLGIIQTINEIQLQVLYINWLYPKIVNGRQSILSSSSKESRQMNTAFFQAVGNSNHVNLEKINRLFENNMLTFEDLKSAFLSLLHLETTLSWGLVPSFNSSDLMYRFLSLKHINENNL